MGKKKGRGTREGKYAQGGGFTRRPLNILRSRRKKGVMLGLAVAEEPAGDKGRPNEKSKEKPSAAYGGTLPNGHGRESGENQDWPANGRGDGKNLEN